MAEKYTDKSSEKSSSKATPKGAAPTSQAQQWPWMAGWPQAPAMPMPGMDEGVERFEAWVTEVDKASQTSAQQATKAIDESARLAKASLKYALDLQARAGTMWLDGMRKASASMRVNTQAGA